MESKSLKWILLFTLALIWGTSFILIKKALLGMSPVQVGAFRTVLAGIILISVGFNAIKGIDKKSWKWVFLSGILGSLFPAIMFAIAQTEIDSAVTSILNSLVPLNTFIIGAILFNVKSSKKQILGVFIGLIGTVLLIYRGAEMNPNQDYAFAILIIISTIAYATNVNIIKRYLQHLNPLSIAAGNYVGIFIPALVILMASGFFTEEAFSEPDFNMSVIYIVILAIFGTAIAKILFNRLIIISSPIFSSSVTYVMPVVAVFWGVLDGENFGYGQAFAIVVILLGVFLSQRKPSAHNKT